jgi:hypothetical protein
VGPGDNLFDNSVDFVWKDNWGLHLNYAPRGGCGNWAATEVIMQRTLGYGAYAIRGVGPVENLDAGVTWSPFFIWSDPPDGTGPNGYRELDFEHSRWGNGGDPTSSQFVLMPLKTNGLVPGWRVRYQTRGGKLATFGGTGQGGGGCNDGGQTGFNNAAISKFTHLLFWYADYLAFATLDGLWKLADVQTAINAGKLVASYKYNMGQGNIPQVGNAKCHINLWHCAGGRGAGPFNGRRVHAIHNGFEFTAARVTPAMPDNFNVQQA